MATDTAGGQVLDAQEGEALWFFGTLTLVKGEGAEKLMSAAQQFGVEILGPPPD